MAIQMRRGLLADYDEDKMVAGELAVTTDSDTEDQQMFVSFGPGDSKRVLLEGDVAGGTITPTVTDGDVTFTIT